MRKYSISLFVISVLCMLSVLSACQQAEPEQTYHNKQYGYSLQYPEQGKVVAQGKAALKSFYFDPLDYLQQLQTLPAFAKIKIDRNSIASIALPIMPHSNLDGKYLITFVVNQIPSQWPLPSVGQQAGNLTDIANKSFFVVHDGDAGMSKQYDYTYYIAKKQDRYYVLLFVLASHTFGVKDTDKVHFDPQSEIAAFQPIVKSLRF